MATGSGVLHVTKVVREAGGYIAWCSCMQWERGAWLGKKVPSGKAGYPPTVIATMDEARKLCEGYARTHRLANLP